MLAAQTKQRATYKTAHQLLPPRWSSHLTYGRDHGDGEVKRAGELPLHPGFVRLQLQHHLLQLVKVLRGQVERLQELRFPQVQLPPLGRLLLRLQRVEDRGAHYQVGEGADDEGEGPHVLPLHGGVSSGARASCQRGSGGRGARRAHDCAALTERRGSLITLWAEELFIQHHPSLHPSLPLQESSPSVLPSTTISLRPQTKQTGVYPS